MDEVHSQEKFMDGLHSQEKFMNEVHSQEKFMDGLHSPEKFTNVIQLQENHQRSSVTDSALQQHATRLLALTQRLPPDWHQEGLLHRASHSDPATWQPQSGIPVQPMLRATAFAVAASCSCNLAAGR